MTSPCHSGKRRLSTHENAKPQRLNAACSRRVRLAILPCEAKSSPGQQWQLAAWLYSGACDSKAVSHAAAKSV